MPAALFVVALFVSIILHEAGHYLAARWAGVRCDRFFFGFGPTLWSRQVGELEVGIKAIPAGGFVTIAGMGEAPTHTDADNGPHSSTPHANVARTGLREQVNHQLNAASGAERRELTVKHLASFGVRRTTAAAAAATLAAGDAPLTDGDIDTLVEALPDKTARRVQQRLREGDAGRMLEQARWYHKLTIYLAGPAANFLQAGVLFIAGVAMLGIPVSSLTVEATLEGSPAQQAGLQHGDRIVEIDGRNVTIGIGQDPLGDAVADAAKNPDNIAALTLTVERDGQRIDLGVTPTYIESFGRAMLGAQMQPAAVKLSTAEAVKEGLVGEQGLLGASISGAKSLGQIFSPTLIRYIFDGAVNPQQAPDGAVYGFVSLGAGANKVQEAFGWGAVMGLFAQVNLAIGLFNLLPIPPLDGGHAAKLLIEGPVRRIQRRRGGPGTYELPAGAVTAVALTFIAFVTLLTLVGLVADIRTLG